MCTIAAGALAVAGVTSAASIGMGIHGAYQSASMAQAQLDMQSQQFGRQQDLQIQQMEQQERQFRENQRFQQAQQRAQMEQQERHHAAQIAQQQRQQHQQLQLQVAQQNALLMNQYKQQQQTVLHERATIRAQDEARRLTYARKVAQANQQIQYNNEAANRRYVEEQLKVNDIRTKAAFDMQKNLAKSIVSRGRVRASGRSGQSFNLLVNDVDRQFGFAKAEQSASMRSAALAQTIGMEAAFLENQSRNHNVQSDIGMEPMDSVLPQMPVFPTLIDGNAFAIQ